MSERVEQRPWPLITSLISRSRDSSGSVDPEDESTLPFTTSRVVMAAISIKIFCREKFLDNCSS